MAIIFSRPQYLFLLLLIPAAIFIYLYSIKGTKKNSIKFANFDALSKIKGVEIFSRNLTLLYLDLFVMVLIILSLSGLGITRIVSATDSSFVLAIDASGSMSADDINPTRLEAAKQASIDFLDLIPEKTKVGVISFSGSSSIQEEITEDKGRIRRAISQVQGRGVGGTDVYEAIVTGTNMLREEDSGIIILMSDGQANVHDLLSLIDYVNTNKVIIYSLGVGTLEGGQTDAGVVSVIQEETLKALAYNTDGNYYRIESIDEFYDALSNLIEIKEKKDVQDLGSYLIISTLVLFFIEFFLANTRFRMLP